jgi:NAD(P)-dependent dehydrogenase (short-subunit alcohol dehydrogenase family)
MGNRLDGKVCVITGAGSGMGRASAVEMARQGGRVTVSDINAERADETAALIAGEGHEAIVIQCDVRSSEALKALMDKSAAHFGGIDVLHNNAAVHETDLTTETSIDEMSEEIWNTVYEVNLRALWLGTKHATPYLKNSTRGASIINVASTGGLVAFPSSGAYCTAKGGVIMLTKATAVDLSKYNIRCNCYCPGSIDTPMMQKYLEVSDDKKATMDMLCGSHLIPRLGKSEEVAKLACFLASEDSSFITGSVYAVDGGALAWRGLNTS